jgi:hypothetical protein
MKIHNQHDYANESGGHNICSFFLTQEMKIHKVKL